MKIDRKLNLVVPIETDSGKIFIHSSAIAKDCFERYFKVISKAYTDIFKEGVAFTAGAGPKIAALMLKSVADEMGIKDDVEKGLMLEIMRLSSVALPTDKGWETMPLSVALKQNPIDEDDWTDAEGQIVFFTLCSSMSAKADLMNLLQKVSGFWGSEITSSNCTEYAASLPKLTPDEPITLRTDASLPS